MESDGAGEAVAEAQKAGSDRRETVLLAVLPFLGSLLAFAFACGQASYYRLPVLFVEIEFSDIAFFTFLAAFGFFALLLFVGISARLRASLNPVARAVGHALFASGLGFIMVLVTFGEPAAWVGLAFLLMIFALSLFVPPLFSRRKDSSYRDRLARLLRQKPLSATEESRDPLGLLIDLAAAGLALALFVFLAGHSFSRNKDDYLIFRQAGQEYAVVYRKGDTFIAKALSPDRKYLLDTVIVTTSLPTASFERLEVIPVPRD